MAEFKVEHSVGDSYDSKVSIEIRIKDFPESDDLAVVFYAIRVLDEFGRKYATTKTVASADL